MKNILHIHGFFRQETTGLGLGYKPSIGSAVFIQNYIGQFDFNGFIFHNENNSGELVGITEDHYGKADLTDIELMPENFLKFIKTYQDRPRHLNPIRYEFKWNPAGFWEGEWNFIEEMDNEGFARCLTSEIPNGFFD